MRNESKAISAVVAAILAISSITTGALAVERAGPTHEKPISAEEEIQKSNLPDATKAERKPQDVESLLLAGQTSLLKNDAVAAARYYRAATLVAPDNSSAFLGLGDALTRLRDEPGANAAFERYRALQGMAPLQKADNAK